MLAPVFAQKEAQREIGASGLPVPRFVSLKAHKANVRVGPGEEYEILWQFKRRGWPVEIIQEHKKWRKIRDYHGDEGWIHASLLRGQRGAIIRPAAFAVRLRHAPKAQGRIIAVLESGVVAKLENCTPHWCKIKAAAHRGWVRRQFIWGVYPFEYQK